MAQDYVHPLQALRAVMVQKRRVLAESLLRSRKGAKAARRRKKIKLQREIDVIDDAIADEQLLSPSLREQLAKERTSEDNASSSVDTAAEPIERVKARLTELNERLTGSATVSKPSAR
jgi:beta-phosphoglucomutase-like phosphatase (HAD superfamily)